jgi:Fur family transcriptional regulator, ferric uptake regulator
MTQSPDVPRLVFDDVAEAIGALRERGLRLSTPRRLVMEALFAAEGPVSAAHLARTLVIEESSVYRNLEVLESYGLIRHVHLGHGPGLYVLLGREELEYLYCDRCAKVTPVPAARLARVRREIKKEFGYEARFTHFAIVGLCEECATVPQPSSPGQPDPQATHQETHSHGDYVHSHPHAHHATADDHEH